MWAVFVDFVNLYIYLFYYLFYLLFLLRGRYGYSDIT